MSRNEGILYKDTELGNIGFKISFYQQWPEDAPTHGAQVGPHYTALIANPKHDFTLDSYARQEERPYQAILTVRGRGIEVSGSLVHFGEKWEERYSISGLHIRKPGSSYPQPRATDLQYRTVKDAIYSAVRQLLPNPFQHRVGADAVRRYCESETESMERKTRELAEEIEKLSKRLALIKEAHASGTWRA